MTGIEYFWIIIVLLFGIVGIVRTYPKELGVTTMSVAALLLLLQFGDNIIVALQGRFGDEAGVLISPRFEAGFYIVVFLLIIYISYQGITLVFKGTPPTGALSPLLGFIVGLLNGYFIAGTVWFYLHKYGYPFTLVDATKLSNLAQRIIHFLPPKVFEPQPGYLLALLLLLLILSVWR
ncbi:MAG: hypothetical protein H8D78_16975 [Chloroflexi bacterium]|nr:hypothetical protein [Chloroflexota bacterium]